MLSGELHSRLDIAEGNTASGPEEIAQGTAERDKVKESLGERFRMCCTEGEGALCTYYE